MICLNCGVYETETSTSEENDKGERFVDAEGRVIQLSFHASPYFSLRHVTCVLQGNVLVLHGHVESFHMKQMAQEIVRRCVTGQLIANLLTVE